MPRKAKSNQPDPSALPTTLAVTKPTANGHSTAAEVEQAAGQIEAKSTEPDKKEKNKFAGLKPTKRMRDSIHRLANAFEDVIAEEDAKYGTTPMIVAAAFGAVMFGQGEAAVTADFNPLTVLSNILGNPVGVEAEPEPEKE